MFFEGVETPEDLAAILAGEVPAGVVGTQVDLQACH